MIVDQATLVWLSFGGKHSPADLVRYINTGQLGQPREVVTPYNPLARELIGKELDKQYGGEK